jgi:hypothetical protein
MADKKLVGFIVEGRNKGYEDFLLRGALERHGWPSREVDKAFDSLERKERTNARQKEKLERDINTKYKKEIKIYLSLDVLRKIEKRADKNLFSVPEQIEDIVRRSTINQTKKTSQEDKVDDMFITFFSRKRR